MSEYKPSALREYIDASELRIVGDDFRIRLSPELAKKYDAGDYDGAIANIHDAIKQVKNIGIKYPANASPMLYVYLVPDERGAELLDFPYGFKTGGRPVMCLDLDGFNLALGNTEDMFLFDRTSSVAVMINEIHEIAHLVSGQFVNKDLCISEGISELIPFYILNYEGKYPEHLRAVKSTQIYSVSDLIGKWDEIKIDAEKRCHNWATYISSYLFMRGVIQKIEKRFGLDKIAALQKFLEFMRRSDCYRVFFIFELADFIGMDRDELLNGKSLQLSVQSDIAKISLAKKQELKTGATAIKLGSKQKPSTKGRQR